MSIRLHRFEKDDVSASRLRREVRTAIRTGRTPDHWPWRLSDRKMLPEHLHAWAGVWWPYYSARLHDPSIPTRPMLLRF